MLKHVDLCSGIGGFALGFEWAGLSQPILFCDTDEWCRTILNKHWPEVPIANDVKELANDPSQIPDCDILTAGYPCQPFSLAGNRKGEADDRHIWPYIRQIVAHKRPTFAVFENVYGHISMGLDKVLADLEAEGYATRTFVVPACGINAVHKRDRLWIIAHANSQGEPDGTEHGQRLATAGTMGNANDNGAPASRDIRVVQGKSDGTKEAIQQPSGSSDTRTSNVANPSSGEWQSRTEKSRVVQEMQGNGSVTDNPSGRSEDVANANGEGLQGHTGTDGQGSRQSGRRQVTDASISGAEEDVANPDSERGCGRASWDENATDAGQSSRGEKPRTGDTQLRMGDLADGVSTGLGGRHGRHEGWEIEPADIPRVAKGQKGRTHKLKGLGNAIVPGLAEQIGLSIKNMVER